MKVYIVDGSYAYSKLWTNAGHEIVSSVEEADIVQFTGGEDVDPVMYGEEKHRTTMCNLRRDLAEAEVFEQCLASKKPMVGICRGGQFLNVMSGGKMWQNVDKHAIGGTHPLYSYSDSTYLGEVSSTHHQMMRPDLGKAIILAHGGELSKDREHLGDDDWCESYYDVEVVLYPFSKSLCFQPHPEFNGAHLDDCRKYFFECVDKLISL